MKRIISIFLAVFMLLGMGTAMVNAERSDFIRNGSFEALTADGKPESWSVQGAPEHFSIVESAKDGKNAVRLACGTENITVTQNVTGLTGGTEYVLTAYMHAKSITGSAQIKLEIYGAEGQLDVIKKSYTDVTRGYEPMVITFTPPAGAVRANLLLRVLGGGEVLWDQVTLMGEGEAPKTADGKTEFIRNGGFEETNADGKLASWSLLSGTEFGTNLEIVDTAKEGKAAIRLNGTGNMTVTQRVDGLVGGSEYIFTVFMNRKSVSDSGAQIKLEFYAGDTAISGADVKRNYNDATRGYKAEVITFNAPNGATRANILVRVLGGGEVLFDGVSLVGEKANNDTAVKPAEPEKPVETVKPTTPQNSEEKEENKEPEVFIAGLANVLTNGDFENDENSGNGGPWGWNPYKSETWEGNQKSVYVKDFGHNSQRCVMLTNSEKGDNPYTQQEVAVMPNATYQLSAWIYSDVASSESKQDGYASIKIEFYGDRPSKEGGHYSEGRMGQHTGTDGQWIQVLHTFTVPADAIKMRIIPRRYGLGTFYIDDVMLCNTEKPSGVTVTTDEVFYYSDHTAPGVATAELNTVAYPEIAGATVDFRLTKDGVTLAEAMGVVPSNNKATFLYDVGLLTEKQAEYKIEVSAGGHINEWKIYKYDRPLNLGADGVYRVNGEVIQPVFAYRYGSGEYKHGVPNGINVAQLGMPTDKEGDALIAYVKDALDKAQEQGVMCLVALYRNMKPGGNEENYSTSEMVVKALRDHPAVFGWMLMDETFNHIPNPFEDLRKSYKVVRDNDPYHPTFLAEATTKLEEAGRYCDILCVDPYPGNHSAPETFPAERVGMAIEAVDGRKPVYSLLQTIDWQGYWPTGDELRNMLYQSLMVGGSAVGYYKFRDSIGTTDLHETDLWPYITAFAQNEQKDAFDAFVFDKYPIFSDLKNNDFWAVSFVKENALHMVILNRKNTAQSISVPLTSVNGAGTVGDFTAVCVAGGNGETITGNGTLNINLIPSGAAVYKITPLDTSVLANASVSRYHDLSGYDWAYASIISLDNAGLVNAIGAHKFSPERKITRGDFAMFLIRTLGLSAENTKTTFTDVAQGAHYAKEIAIGEALGILKGVGDGRYMPEAEISRQDLMAICARGMQLVKELTLGNSLAFTDASTIADYAEESIGAMTNAGIVKGYEDGSIRPLGNTTRAEAAVIMNRILGWR